MDWSSVVVTFTQWIRGLAMFFFAYCPDPPNIGTMVGGLASDFCSVNCGLVSFFLVPGVYPILGTVAVIVGGLSLISMLGESFLAASFKLARGILGKFSGSQQRQDANFTLNIANLSPTTGLALVLVGGMLTGGNAGDLVTAVASALSGLALSGVISILNLATQLVAGRAICP